MRSSAIWSLALAARGAFAQDMGTSSAYTDSSTGISFQGYTDPTGYRFGLVMPQSPTTDFVAQLISPLKNGAGWAGVDFGESMTGPLLLVAWPNGNDVMIAPRIASGYDVPDTVAYNGPGASSISITPIGAGTYVNSTHVVATFLCGGCMNADSFTASNTSGTSSVSMAYSSVVVADPSDANTLLSDHTTAGEPYGAFGFNFAEAKSSQYTTFAALASSIVSSPSSTPSSGGASPTEAGAQASSTATLQTTGSDTDTDIPTAPISAGMVVLLLGIGIVYMTQPFI